MKLLFTIAALAMSLAGGLSQGIVINEVAYTNDGIVIDAEGDSPDWFELYNDSEVPVNLSGYKITDDTSKTEYWKFPDYTMIPGEFLLVFASDKNVITGPEFHTSFRLSNMRESLYLIGPDNAITDQIDPVCVPLNHSRARMPDGSANLVVSQPTPGASNNTAIPVTVNFIPDTLMVNTESGFFEGPISLSFQHLHSVNEIRYTLDGEVPEDDSEIYSGPIQLKDLTSGENRFANIPETDKEPGNLIYKANIVRAVVYSNGCPASNEITNTYFLNKDIRYPVPVISLITEEDNLFDDETGIYVHGKYRNFDQQGSAWERPVHVEIFDENQTQVIDQDAGMRIHGRGTRRSPQKSLRLYADNEYGKEYFEYPYFSQKPWLEKFKVLLVRTTGSTMGSLFKEELCHFLVKDMNIDYAAGHTAILFINGEYWGIYNLMERHNKYYVENNYNIENADVDIVAYDMGVTIEEGTSDEYVRLVNYIQNANPDSDDFYESMNRLVDMDNLMEYFCAQIYLANSDWPFSNLDLWKLRNDTARWRYFFFDLDASMDWHNDDHLTEYNNNFSDYQRYDEFSTLIFRKAINNEQFRSSFFERFSHHIRTTFSTARVLNAIDYFERKYAPLVPENLYRWDRPNSYLKWEDNVNWLRTFAVQRPLALTEQVRQNFGNSVEIVPNPSSGNFKLQFVIPPESVNVTINSVKGEILDLQIFKDVHDSVLPVTVNLPPGIYILRAESGTVRYSGKLVIQ